jgi:arginase
VPIELMGFPTALGLPRKAYRHGPEVLRAAGLVQRLERHGEHVNDFGDLALPEAFIEDNVADRVRKVVTAARRQAEQWHKRHKPGNLMMTLGGDHSTSLGTIQALAAMEQSFDILWIDAHGDFNVLETSPSGNPHGMVLSLACGLMPEFMPGVVTPESLRLWGIRDLDSGERRLLEREHVAVLTPEQVRRDPDELVRSLNPNVFISFDIDSVDPAEAPGTMVPVPGGFSSAEALELVAAIVRSRRVLALDIVEFHPDVDRNDLTVNLALAVAETAISGRVPALRGPRAATAVKPA